MVENFGGQIEYDETPASGEDNEYYSEDTGSDSNFEQSEDEANLMSLALEADIVPTLEEIQVIRDRIENEYIPNLVIVLDNLEQAQILHPDLFNIIEEYYPGFQDNYSLARDGLIRLASHSEDDPLEFRDLINAYNAVARANNEVVQTFVSDFENGDFTSNLEALADPANYEDLAETLSEREASLMIEMANEIKNELFPRTGAENFVYWASGLGNRQELRAGAEPTGELADWQRIAIAPMAGLEQGIRNFFEIADPRNLPTILRSIYNLGSTLLNPEERRAVANVISHIYQNNDTVDNVSMALSLIYSFAAMGVLAGEVASIARIPRGLSMTYRMAAVTGLKARMMPIAVIEGIALPYIERSF